MQFRFLQFLRWLNEQEQKWTINAVAHRIVHGGELFISSVLLNEEITNELKQLNSLAPLHQPHNVAAVEIIKKLTLRIII